MNERIKELRHQAINYCMDKGSQGNLSEEVAEKFAELIVKECMEVASPNYMSTPEDSAYYVELAIDRIADHFGVEE
jgi:hypothetical protein